MERMRKLLRSDEVVAQVRRDIADGVYRPGDALPEPDALATELGVLTKAVAAAYQRLAEDGVLLENLLTPGVVVADPELDPTVRSLVHAVAGMRRHLERLDQRLDDLTERVDTVGRSVRASRLEARRDQTHLP
ncbi:GntR family transcriptional regulator [Streptomyces buecherae]|uniref:GntR family transcriptional regulator n=1 Tax=Streptomyces buecherae TaxID=2763006 RepID=A0A7H8N209_9ACTN|nr:GntR family transcriptional regulator [Streptomyces buecherae]QKW48534.1 GntR family transcriptional regulator [Streptomyces buecherae]